MLDFCFDKPIGIALSCFNSVLSNITCFLVCVLDYMLNFCFDKPIEIALGCFDSVLSNITCFLVLVLDFCFDKPIEIALGCFDSVLSNIPLNLSLCSIHTFQVSSSNTNTSTDVYFCDISLILHNILLFCKRSTQ